MYYTGNHLFHYTSFESAMRIIATKSLKFGEFGNMNDIAEVKKELYGSISSDIIESKLSRFHSLSFTKDEPDKRGYSIDPLWGHYAQRGNGVCLVFAKDKLEHNLKEQFEVNAYMESIEYTQESPLVVFEGKTPEAVEKYIEEKIKDIFFTKSCDWSYENEIRILVKAREEKSLELLHFNDDVLIAAILCLPKEPKYKNTAAYKVLKRLLPEIPILHYTTSLFNKELLDEDDNEVGSNREEWEF